MGLGVEAPLRVLFSQFHKGKMTFYAKTCIIKLNELVRWDHPLVLYYTPPQKKKQDLTHN